MGGGGRKTTSYQIRHTTCRATFLEYPLPVAGFASWIPRFSRKSSGVICLFYINVGDQLSLSLVPVTARVYQPRGINALQRLFKEHFQGFADQYEAKHAIIYGRFRIERITEVVEKFILSGDYTPGTMWQTLLFCLQQS